MEAKRLLTTLKIALRWMDLDAYAHLGNSRFFDFMTDARVAAFAEFDFLTDQTIQYVVADAQCSFKSPVYYPGNLVVDLYCEKVGNSSFTLSYRFYMEGEPDLICAEGRTIMVCFNTVEKRPVRLQENVSKYLNTK